MEKEGVGVDDCRIIISTTWGSFCRAIMSTTLGSFCRAIISTTIIGAVNNWNRKDWQRQTTGEGGLLTKIKNMDPLEILDGAGVRARGGVRAGACARGEEGLALDMRLFCANLFFF